MCEHRMCDDPTGLKCTRPEDVHPDRGHTYESGSGSATNDALKSEGGHG